MNIQFQILNGSSCEIGYYFFLQNQNCFLLLNFEVHQNSCK